MDSHREGIDGQPATVKTLEACMTNFNKEWPNIHHRLHDILLEEKVVVAGGSVLRAMTASEGIRMSKLWGEEQSDVDLFVYGCGIVTVAVDIILPARDAHLWLGSAGCWLTAAQFLNS